MKPTHEKLTLAGRKWCVPLVALALVVLAPGRGMAGPVVSTSGERESLALTVYNTDLALVRETRRVALEKGTNTVRFEGVAREIIPESVRVAAPKAHVAVLEQRYRYDLQSPERLMQKYVGKKVKVLDRNPATGEDRVIEAVLLSVEGKPTYKVGNEIHVGLPERVIFPELPKGLLAAPTLIWQLASDRGSDVAIEVSYLTKGIRWQADYNLVLAPAEKRGDLAAWATIDNQSGAAYPEAALRLVAGTVNRVETRRVRPLRYRAAGEVGMAASLARVPQEPVSEYHLYRVERPVSLAEREKTQLELFRAAGIAIDKRYILRASPRFFRQRLSMPPPPQAADVSIEFDNTEKNHLGSPLPEGIARIYTADAQGTLRFAGEDRVHHTPADEKVRLRAGKAFDVVAERQQTDYKVVAKNVWEVAWEISLRNRKAADVTVRVLETVANDWEVISASHPHVKEDAETIRFEVPVAAGGEATLKYRVRVRTRG